MLSGGKALVFPWHMHLEHWTVGVVLVGTLVLNQPEGKRTLGAGHHFVLPPSAPHSLALDAQAQLLTMCIPLGSEPDAAGECIDPLVHHACNERGMPVPVPYAHWRALLRKQRTCFGAVQNCSSRSAQGSRAALVVAETIGHKILDAPEQPLSLARMAQEAGYSPWHFVRMFQRHMGIAPHALITLCRVRMVRQALRANVAGAEAAASAGFTDQSHMLRVFKQHHNMTPGQFAKASVKVG